MKKTRHYIKYGNRSERAVYRAINIADSVIYNTMIAALLSGLLIGAYFYWDGKHTIYSGDSAEYMEYKPSGGEASASSFAELVSENKDIFGWLTVFGTHIDYPLLQGKDNQIYKNHNASGKFETTGSIFLDADSSKDFENFNNIVYGHRMADNVMFGDIDNFFDKEYFDEHKYANLYYNGANHGVAFFAFIDYTKSSDERFYQTNIQDDESKNTYIETIRIKAKHFRDLNVNRNDRLVTFSTCSDNVTNARYLLIGKITDEDYTADFGDDAAPVSSAEVWYEDVLEKVMTIPANVKLVAMMLCACVSSLLLLLLKRRVF